MFRGAYSYLKILAACVIPLVSACVVVPLGSEIDQDQIIEFHPGITHRSAVIEEIGEPNIFSGGGFDVYHLEEGKYALLNFLLEEGVDGAKEIYNLVFHYDTKGLLQELRYEKSLDPNDPDLILLDNDFTGRVKDFTADGEYSSVYISADGRLITAISKTNIVIQEVEGESREIELEQMNLDSWGYGLDCVIDLYNHRRTKQNPDFNWLIGIQDLRPLFRLCMTNGAFGVTAKGAYGVTADGSGLAVANTNQLEILLQTGDVLSAPEADQAPIHGIWFDGMENHVVTSSVELEIRFMQDPLNKTELKIRSLPSLNTIESIRRPFGASVTAMSDDNRLFALAASSHVELWRRIKDPGESPGSDGHYELARIIPKKPTKGVRPTEYLKFSPDGEHLMAVGSWITSEVGSWDNGEHNGRIYLWETNDGRPIAEIAKLGGLIEASFNQNNEIVIVSGQESWSFPSPKYQSLKIWHLPLESVKGTRGKTPSPEVVTPAIVATTEKVSDDIDITDTDISEFTSKRRREETERFAKLSEANAAGSRAINNLSGTYMSIYTGGELSKSPDFRNEKVKVRLVQNGKAITGTFGESGKVWGNIIDGKTIKFELYATGGFTRHGTWIFDSTTNSLKGKLRTDAAEEWNLTRIQ